MLNDVLHNPGEYTSVYPFVCGPYVHWKMGEYKNVTSDKTVVDSGEGERPVVILGPRL